MLDESATEGHASEESVSQWLQLLQGGNPKAVQPLWERYFHRLVGLARAKLESHPRRAADEEDVALSAFASFCRAAEAGRFPQLADRDDLWRLLVTLTERKAWNMIRDERRQKRGGGAVMGESGLIGPTDSAPGGLDQLAGREPTPAFAAQVAEEYRLLLGRLDDAELQFIAVRKMEGETVPEIAARLNCAPRSIERRLRLIRQIWEEEEAA
jgi:DNA-directed RNA polymerase specialized sigma24 family protein